LILLVNLARSAGLFGGQDYQPEKAMSNDLFYFSDHFDFSGFEEASTCF